MKKNFCIEVSGKYACFTNPIFKAERVSYYVITPSAARNILQSIYWKPCITWCVKRIEIINPITWTNVCINELKCKADTKPIIIEDQRTQRNSLILTDVRYRIFADMIFNKNHKSNNSNETAIKHFEIFTRRAAKGQFFKKPYLGCREFACDVRLIEDISNEIKPVTLTTNLGQLLYDLDFSQKNPMPIFFIASVINGGMDIPALTGVAPYVKA